MSSTPSDETLTWGWTSEEESTSEESNESSETYVYVPDCPSGGTDVWEEWRRGASFALWIDSGPLQSHQATSSSVNPSAKEVLSQLGWGSSKSDFSKALGSETPPTVARTGDNTPSISEIRRPDVASSSSDESTGNYGALDKPRTVVEYQPVLNKVPTPQKKLETSVLRNRSMMPCLWQPQVWEPELEEAAKCLKLDNCEELVTELVTNLRVASAGSTWSSLGVMAMVLTRDARPDWQNWEGRPIPEMISYLSKRVSTQQSLPAAMALCYLSALIEAHGLVDVFQTAEAAAESQGGQGKFVCEELRAEAPLPPNTQQAFDRILEVPAYMHIVPKVIKVRVSTKNQSRELILQLMNAGTPVLLHYQRAHFNRGLILSGSRGSEGLDIVILSVDTPSLPNASRPFPLSLEAAFTPEATINPMDTELIAVQIVETKWSTSHLPVTPSAMATIVTLSAWRLKLKSTIFWNLLFGCVTPHVWPVLLRQYPNLSISGKPPKQPSAAVVKETFYHSQYVERLKGFIQLYIKGYEKTANSSRRCDTQFLRPVFPGGLWYPVSLSDLTTGCFLTRKAPLKLFSTTFEPASQVSDICSRVFRFRYEKIDVDLKTLLNKAGGTFLQSSANKYRGWVIIGEDKIQEPVIPTLFGLSHALSQKKNRVEVAFQSASSLAIGVGVLQHFFGGHARDDPLIKKDSQVILAWPFQNIVSTIPSGMVSEVTFRPPSAIERDPAASFTGLDKLKARIQLIIIKEWWKALKAEDLLNINYRSKALIGAANVAMQILKGWEAMGDHGTSNFEITLERLPSIRRSKATLLMVMAEYKTGFLIIWWMLFFIRIFGFTVGDMGETNTDLTIPEALSLLASWANDLLTTSPNVLEWSLEAMLVSVKEIRVPLERLLRSTEEEVQGCILTHARLTLTCPVTASHIQELICTRCRIKSLVVERSGPPMIHHLVEASFGRPTLKNIYINYHSKSGGPSITIPPELCLKTHLSNKDPPFFPSDYVELQTSCIEPLNSPRRDCWPCEKV
eukprot:Blabericola_migrator_1__11335@NODE_66_length_15680_cov_202_244988_g59_i0_p1_GENE_NODE_66_length_15680_cov_202_244988_g59_i0NODE_66_length_15680_cov_202_244988_g59_i0_p1_ORF_typecomplete_len1019_score181_62_NODE_66_length_15680_cov_202_244988_g59_i0825711313